MNPVDQINGSKMRKTNTFFQKLTTVAVCSFIAISALQQQSAVAKVDQLFHGPALGISLRLPAGDAYEVMRGIIVPLDETGDSCVVFDMDTMRLATGWTEGRLSMEGLPFTNTHGRTPSVDDPVIFQVPNAPACFARC